MGFFSNNSRSLYDYLKQREMVAQQETLYGSTDKTFRAICLSFYELNTPALRNVTPAPSTGTTDENQTEGSSGSSTTAGVSTVGGQHRSPPNAQLASQTVKQIEKMTVRIRFIGKDSMRNGFLTEDPLSPGITSSKRKALINMAPTATVLDLGLVPNHQDIMTVRQDKEGIYYVEKIIGNLNGIIPVSTPAGQTNLSQQNYNPDSNMGNYNANATELGANQARHYTPMNREVDGTIDLIVLHSTAGHTGAGRAQRCIDYFAGPRGPTRKWTDPNTKKTNPPCSDYPDGWPAKTAKGREIICHPTKKVLMQIAASSVHYATDSGGAIVQGCLDKDKAWHAGDSAANRRSIGIEMCGRPNEFPGQGAGGKYAKMYDDVMLEATAKLCAHLCRKHNIPVRFAEDKGKGLAGHEQFTPEDRCDPGWILNKHEHSKNLGGTWHKSKWRKKHKEKAAKHGAKPGDLKYPEGNYWDWDDFIARVQKHFDAGTPINISRPNPLPPEQPKAIENPATSSGEEKIDVQVSQAADETAEETLIAVITEGDIEIVPGIEWQEAETNRFYQLDGDYNKVYLDDL